MVDPAKDNGRIDWVAVIHASVAERMDDTQREVLAG
jgi:hypothetical protein